MAVVGASGGLGGAFVDALAGDSNVARVIALSRSPTGFTSPKVCSIPIDLEDEASIGEAARACAGMSIAFHLVIVASGILHDGDGLQPEKSWRSLDGAALEQVLRINSVGPALVAKHFLPMLDRSRRSAFAAVSARVGSIEDNWLGGWYAYRASKAALNMLIRTLAIELARRNPTALCVALHPGTVDTSLSEPFQSAVPNGKLFSPSHSAACLLDVLDRLTPADSGYMYAWDGNRIPF